MAYTTRLGRGMLRDKHIIPNQVENKWPGVLPSTYRLRWRTVWLRSRCKNEAGLPWLLWHRAVAVNVWQGRISQEIVLRCLVCPRGSDESVLHRFWEYDSAQRAWQWGIHVLKLLVAGADASGPWQPLSWR